jgi:hypothetical protein
MFPKLLEVKPLENYTLWLKYDDETEGCISFNDLLGKGVFAIWENEIPFEKVYINQQKAIAWNDEIDICSDSMYLKIKELSFENYKKQSNVLM